jgi:hypothetical protein
MLQPTDKRRSEKLEWTSHHVLLSVSVYSNVPTYTEPDLVTVHQSSKKIHLHGIRVVFPRIETNHGKFLKVLSQLLFQLVQVIGFLYSIGGQSQDQVYRETEQQFHVYQDREAEVSRHHQLPGSWF